MYIVAIMRLDLGTLRYLERTALDKECTVPFKLTAGAVIVYCYK